MKRTSFSITFIILIFCASELLTSAQTGTEASATASNKAAPQSTNKTRADETFDLNITERRITEHNFAASTTVEAGEETARGLHLRVGVAVGAEEIDLLLRNVTGRVRFRATLERVLDRINARRPTGAVP